MNRSNWAKFTCNGPHFRLRSRRDNAARDSTFARLVIARLTTLSCVCWRQSKKEASNQLTLESVTVQRSENAIEARKVTAHDIRASLAAKRASVRSTFADIAFAGPGLSDKDLGSMAR